MLNSLPLFLFALLLLCSCHGFTPLTTKNLVNGNNSTDSNDIYVFAYSWTPQFCYGEDYPGCDTPEKYWETHFTIHGVWPQYASGGYPADCDSEAFDPNVPVEIGWDTMTNYWPDVKYTETDPDYDSFWEHEWTKHGTCTGLSQYDYFSAGINLIKSFGTPASVTNSVGGSVEADSLRKDFGGASYGILQCDGGQYLSGIYTCWTNVNGIPTTQIECPTDVQGEDTCTSTDVEITAL